MSNLLHGPISSNQILPREKRANRDIFSLKPTKHGSLSIGSWTRTSQFFYSDNKMLSNLNLNKLRTTSVDDIRQKLADKKEKQLVELRRIEDDIAAGRLERPLASQALGQPIPGELNWGQVKIIKG